MNNPDNEQQEINTSAANSETAIDALVNMEMQLERYVLRLYIARQSPKSIRAIRQIKNLCEERLPGRYELEIVDIHQQPELMEEDHIIAIPTLIKKLPPPLQRLIGDMTNTEKIIISLDL